MSFKYQINEKYISMKEDIFNIKTIFLASDKTIHKARNELKVVPIKNISTVMKSFKIPNIINKFAYSFFRDSKAKKSYYNSIKIQEFTPIPIAYIEYYKYGLIYNSYFINEEFSYDFTIREPLLDDNFHKKESILRAFTRFSLQLHNQEIFHNDYSPGNILIKKEASEFIFKIVDINRMKFSPLSQDKRAQNFSKLWANEDELKIIADEYAKHYNVTANFYDQLCYHSNKNKRIKNLKKKLKGKK